VRRPVRELHKKACKSKKEEQARIRIYVKQEGIKPLKMLFPPVVDGD